MKQIIKHIILVILFLTTGLQAIAQTYPVQAIPQVQQPPVVYLSDYASLNNATDRIKLQLLLTDLTVLNREVKLKLYIEGNGIKAQSNDFVIGVQPLFLEGGIPLQLGSIDLAPYFELQNLKGISAGAYANTLPDGLYQFCFEVYDVLSSNVISRKSCTNVLIFLNDPPFLNLPENQANIAAYNPQNLLFQWTPRHINVSNVEYEFSLVEIYDTMMSPEAVFVSSPPIYQTTVQTTSLVYGLAKPQLLEGKRYAWRVQARALDGVDEIGMFKNNGYSEIFSFTYQGECEAPAYLTIDEVTSQNATFKWQGGFDHTQYKIAYRKAIDNDGNSGQQNSFTWFESTTNSEQFTVIDLEPNTLYEWRVGGFCADGSLTYTKSESFTTMEADAEAYYNCGIEPNIDIANQTLIDKLQDGDVVKAGDFNVKIQEVSGSSSFSGKGYTTVGFLKNIKIALVFTNIQVNTNYQFVSGEIKTVYDPTWSNILDADEVIDVIEDLVDVVTGDDNINITLDYNIEENDISVDTQAGTITITDDNNDPQVYDYDEGDFYTITDASGDQFSIGNDGKPTKTGVGAEGGPATAANTNGVSDGHKNNVTDPAVNTIQQHNITFIYKKGSDTTYELDLVNNEHEKATYPKVNVAGGDSYYPIHKAVVKGSTDTFDVEVTNSTAYIKTDSLIFKTVYGTEIPSTRTAKGYTLTVKGRSARISEEAIITYKDNTGKQHVLSSFFIYHLKKFSPVAINVVRINGADDITNLQNKLNKIYGSTGVTFTVNNVEEFEVPEAVWDVDATKGQIDYNGSGLDSDYPKELNAIKNYYKQEHSGYDAKAYYLFLIDDSMPVTKALSGFMPKTRQWGFVFQAHLNEGLENKKEPADIAAHEIGHGVFALAHPFDKPEDSGKASTWLMDYGNGTELAYPNWANMSSDALKLYLFQSDQDSESSIIDNIPKEFANKDSTFTFMTLNGSFITLPKNVKDVWFTTGLDKLDKFIGYPIGAITRFTLDGKIYSAKTNFNSISNTNNSLTKNDLTYIYSGFEDKNGNNIGKNYNNYNNPNNKEIICLIPYYASKTSEHGYSQGNYGGYMLQKVARFDLKFEQNTSFNILDNYDKIKNYYKADVIASERYKYDNKHFHRQYELQQILMDEILGQGSWGDKHAILAKYAILYNAQPELFKEVTLQIFKETYDEAFTTGLETLKSNYIPFISQLNKGTEDLLQQFNSIVADGNSSLLDAYWWELYEIVEKLPSELIEDISFENRKVAINLLLRQEARKYLIEGTLVKKDKYEDQILRLIKFIKPSEIDLLIKYLEEGRITNNKDHLWYYAFHKLDNSLLGFNKDNRTNFIRILTEHFYKSENFIDAVNKHEQILITPTKDILEDDLKYFKRREIVSDYKNIYERTWASLTVTHPLLFSFINPNDAYSKYSTDYQKENGSLEVEKKYAFGFGGYVKDIYDLKPFDLIYYRTTSSIGALSDFKTGELVPLPAIVLYYDDNQQGNATTQDVAQLAFDVGTLVIPGTQFTKLKDVGKLIYILDKISSLTSIAGSALQAYDPKTAGLLNDISIALGLVDIANLTTNGIKGSMRTLTESEQGYKKAISIINDNADDLSKIEKKAKEQIANVLNAERKVLIDAGSEADELESLASTLNKLEKGANNFIEGVVKSSKTNLFEINWINNVKGHGSTSGALKLWNDESKQFKHLVKGDLYLKYDETVGDLVFGNHATQEILGFYEGVENVGTIGTLGLNKALNKLKIYHGQGSSHVNLNLSSGAIIITNPNKTATIVGNFKRYPWPQGDMKELVMELLGGINTQQFGPKKGGFNILNISKKIADKSTNFWEEFNLPWLKKAIDRGDDIWAASNPLDLSLIFNKPLSQIDNIPTNINSDTLSKFLKSYSRVENLSGFGKETKTLFDSGYLYNFSTKMFLK